MTLFVIIVIILIVAYLAIKYSSVVQNKNLLVRREYLDNANRISRAIPALATVVSLTSKNLTPAGEKILTHLVLNVMPPGGTNYVVSTDWEIEPLGLSDLKPGIEVAIKIDAEDPKRIYPNVSWAKYWQLN